MPTEVTKEELAELNAQRIKLGLKPLDVEPSDAKDGNKPAAAAQVEEDPDAVAEANFARVQSEARKAREAKALEERIAKAKNKRELARRLVGRSLGEAEEGDKSGSGSEPSTLAWLKASKKRAKEHAARRLQQQMEEQEAQVQAEYGQSDLAGLRVRHDADDFEDGEERILTLRDARVLDDEAEDELVDSVLAQRERDEENAGRRRGAKKYTGLDDEEFGDAAGPGASRSSAAAFGKRKGVLSKYDADLEAGGGEALKGDGDVGFRIGGPVRDKAEIRAQQAEEAARLANRQLLNLDYAKNVEVSDYLQEGEIGFKKAKGKKKKRAATRVKVELDDDVPTGADSGSAARASNGDTEMADAADPTAAAAPRQRIIETDNFVDDDELQASLAKARRQKAKKTLTKLTPEQIAANLAAQRKEEEEAKQKRNGQVKMELDGGGDATGAEAEAEAEEEDEDKKGLTFDSTTEFVRNLAFKAVAEEPRRPTVKTEAAEPSLAGAPPPPAAEPAADQATGTEPVAEAGPSSGTAISEFSGKASSAATVEDGEEDEDMEDLSDLEDLDKLEVYAVPANGDSSATTTHEGDAASSSSSEPLAGGSMAATLSLLRQQGLLQEYTPDLREKEARQREYDLWLAERKRREAVRRQELAASKAKGSSVDQATREYENKQRELADAREAARRFENYQPTVDIKYHDQHGRELSAKKAWKLLSHRFHGKGPGHKKQELEMRRLENERKREKMQSGDTPTGMGKAFQDRSERTGQAHMVLSVGARGNAPQELSMLGPDITKSARPAPALPSGPSGGAKGKGKGKVSALAGGVAALRQGEVSAGITSIGLQSFVPRNVGGSGLASVVPSGAARRHAGNGAATPSGTASDAAGGTSGAADTPPPHSRPAMKPAFAPIKRAAATGASGDANGHSGASTPDVGSGGAGSRFKLQLGAKRKADEAAPAPVPEGKRRA